LVTKGVPCEKRIKDLKFLEEDGGDLEREAEDGWVETLNPMQKKQGESLEREAGNGGGDS
jgi:hypothetical protein